MDKRSGATRSRGPDDPVLRLEWRSARRVVARRHHPDLGGDPAVLQRELASVDCYFASRDRAPFTGLAGADAGWLAIAPPLWQPATRLWRRSSRRLRRSSRALRARLPRRWPGSRRYFDV